MAQNSDGYYKQLLEFNIRTDFERSDNFEYIVGSEQTICEAIAFISVLEKHTCWIVAVSRRLANGRYDGWISKVFNGFFDAIW